MSVCEAFVWGMVTCTALQLAGAFARGFVRGWRRTHE